MKVSNKIKLAIVLLCLSMVFVFIGLVSAFFILFSEISIKTFVVFCIVWAMSFLGIFKISLMLAHSAKKELNKQGL